MKREAGPKKNCISYLENHRGGRLFLLACLSFGGVCTFPRMLHGGQEEIGYTNSIFSVFLFLFLFWLLEKIVRETASEEKVRWFWPGCFGTFFSVCMIFGTSLDKKGSVSFGEGGMWAGIWIWAVLFTLLTRYLWN
ncbi:MAG: hypothetical protein NC400_11550, partial [Clostridium sp.]|nr:hypothetical protein [Clostridium sp.]